ncbi:hypothetical protein JZO77_12425 [Enterococcus hulanensis]|uniref:hypothetical protein n=1 Tax=Enterococcus hulanensis TaxID=2559929 RepID=UPI001A8E6B60|nr:hypothetical protein [Enterococcus hulanensis]MBO0457536.1 hypothetical protein [Enterococcus hulanensis]
MVYSRWVDNTNIALGDLINKLMMNVETKKGIIDPFDNTSLLVNVDKFFDDNQIFEIDGKTVTYNYFFYQHEYLKKYEKNNPLREKRVGSYSANIIIFNYNNKNNYIVNKGYNNTTLGKLRELVGYSGKLEISEQRIHGIKTDLFIWMIHHLLDNPKEYFDEIATTKVESVIGFRGETDDKLAEISGSGEKIMEMLTTLLFLFENQNISKVETTIFRKNERFKLTLGEKSFVDIDFNSYEGDDFFGIREENLSKIAIKVFVDVVPSIILFFSNELDQKKWSEKKEEMFFRSVGRELSKKINERLRNKK